MSNLGFPGFEGFMQTANVAVPKGAAIKKTRMINISAVATAILNADPPIKGIISWRGGLVSQQPYVDHTLKAIKQLDMFVVIEQFMTDDTDWADLVLPACHFLEQYGLHTSYWHHYNQILVPVCQPYFEAVPDVEIFEELGRRLGYEEYFPRYRNGIDYIRMLVGMNTDVDAAIYNSAYDALIEDNMEGYLDKVRVLYQYEIKTEVETKTEKDKEHVRSVDQPFNLYISGIDTLGKISTTSRSDVNMIMTVNPQTHTILMTNTPRDYFVLLPDISGTTRDKLTHAGIYGIDASMNTISALYDVPLDYYIRVNFTSLVTLIDAMGGIDVNSDYEFNCLWKGYHINKGMNHLNGDQTLGFIRERYAFPDGDNQRGRNEQQVMAAIIDQLTTATGISSAPRLLSVLSDCMETDMTQAEFSKLINRQISEGGKWNIETQAVTGRGDMQPTFSGGSQELFVMWPDEDGVKRAADKIKQVMDQEGSGSTTSSEETALPFTDVKEGDWYYSFVKDVFNKGLMSGNDDGTFGVTEEVSRVQMCLMLQALAGSSADDLTEPFTDVAEDVWYHDAVAWAYQNGLVDGITSSEFRPNNKVTRGELVLMLYRYAGSPEVKGDIDQFNDSVNIDPAYVDAILWAVDKGLVEGDDKGAFRPNNVATRLDIAVILSKFSSMSESTMKAPAETEEQAA